MCVLTSAVHVQFVKPNPHTGRECGLWMHAARLRGHAAERLARAPPRKTALEGSCDPTKDTPDTHSPREIQRATCALTDAIAGGSFMVPPVPRGNHAPSKDILRSAARRIQLAARDCDGDGFTNRKQQEEAWCHIVNKIWCAIGLTIEHSLLSAARGVRIESFGTFSLNALGRPRFFLAANFAARHRLLKYDVCSGGCLAGGSVNTRLNVARVAATAGSSRPEAERAVNAVLRSLHQRLANGRFVTLSFHPVAEFSCTPSGQATMRFLPGFRTKQEKMAGDATRVRVGTARANTSTTPWGSGAATGVANGNVGGPSSTGGKQVGADPEETGRALQDSVGRKDVPVGRRPRSSNSTRSIQPENSIRAADRPETSIGFDDRRRSSLTPKSKAATSVVNRKTSSASSSVQRSTVMGVEKKAANDAPSSFGASHTHNNSRFLTAQGVSHPSCFSDGQQGCHHGSGKGSSRGSSDVVDEIIEHGAQDEIHCPSQAHQRVRKSCGSKPRLGLAERRQEHQRHQPEEKMSSLLRRQTLAQAGEEGLRRLAETLRLTHVTDERRGEGGSGIGRLSGRDLLLALRDVGTTLTSAELEETTKLFRQQPDGRVSLPVLLAGISTESCGRQQHQRAAAPGAINEENMHPSSNVVGTKEVGTARGFPTGASPQRFHSGLPWEISEHQAELSKSCSPRAGWASSKAHSTGLLSTPRLSDSSTVYELLQRKSLAIKGRPHTPRTQNAERLIDGLPRHRAPPGGGGDQSGGGCDNAIKFVIDSDAELLAGQDPDSAPSAVPQQARRQCWGDDNIGGERAGAVVATSTASPEDDVVDLAKILFNPPSSLEGLIHVLQANKINEQPTISCAALGARLVQLRPGLGKARAKRLALAACRFPDKQVYLEELHALLERRFGRCQSSGRGSFGGRNASRCTTAANVCGVNETSSASAKGTTAATMGATVSSLSSSCVALERVRRKLLVGEGGLGRLKAALFSVGGGDGGGRGVGERGTLTKDELRRALTMTRSAGSSPPSTKDVDDLFTMFSGRTPSGGVGGARVDAVTVFRGLRGELSPFRERVVRDVFSALLRISSESPNKNSSDRSRSLVDVEELRKAHCSGSGSIDGRDSTGCFLQGNSGSTGKPGGGSISGLGEWCSLEVGPGCTEGVPPQAVVLSDSVENRDTARGRRTVKGVSLEHFLEYYRDVSAGIDGDDAFEAKVRASWPLQRPLSQSKRRSGGAPSTVAFGKRGNDQQQRDAMGTAPSSLCRLGGRQQADRGDTDLAESSGTVAAAEHKRSTPPGGRGGKNGSRQAAAVRVQALFRGHRGRECAAGEGRKRARRLAVERAAEEERQRPRAVATRRMGGRISRPKGPSTYGF